MFLFPGFKNVRRRERRNHWAHPFPNCGLCPSESRAARSKHPLVGACDERIASESSDLRIFHSQPVHAIDDQKHTILFLAVAIHFSKALRDTSDGQPHTAAGVDPGHAHGSRLWSDRFANAFGYFVRRNRAVGIEKRNLATGCSTAAGGKSNRFVMHVVIVRSREYLIAFTQRQSMVNNGQPGSRVLGQRDVLRVAADVIANGTANLERNVLVSRFENCAVNATNGFASIFARYCSIAWRTGLGWEARSNRAR